MWVLRKFLSTMDPVEAMEFLLDKLKRFKTKYAVAATPSPSFQQREGLFT